MATNTDAWKQITGIGDPARTIAAETALLDKQHALVQEGNKNIVDLVKGIGQSDADRIAAEAKNLFNTGNPLIDNRDRIAFGEGQVGIHSPGQLSKLFGEQLKTDQDTVQSEAKMFDQVKTMRDSQLVTSQLPTIDFTTPTDLQDAIAISNDNYANNVKQTELTDRLVDTITNEAGLNYNQDNIFASMKELDLDINDPNSYTSTVETSSINKSADKVQELYPGLNRKLATTVATKLLGKTKHAGHFARGKTKEAAKTIDTIKVDELSNELVNAANLDPDLTTTYDSKVKAVNNALKHVAKTAKMPKEDKERWNNQIMTVLDSMNLIPGSGRQGRFGEARSIFSGLFKPVKNEKGEIIHTVGDQVRQQLRGKRGVPLGIQARFKDHIRKRLKDPKTGFPQLTDEIVNAHIDKLVAADPDLGPAFTKGKFLAAERTALETASTQSAAAIRLRDNKKLQQINITGGGPETAINDTLAKLTEKGIIDQTQVSLDGQNKFRLQATRVYTDLRDSFIYDDPETGEQIDLLDDKGLDAFNMAYHKMLTGKTRVQKDTGLFGVQAWFTPDYDIAGAGGEMSKRDPQNLLRILLKSVPSKASDAMKTNIKSFKEAVFKRKKAVAAGAKTDAMKNWGLWDKIITRIGG